MLLTFVEVVNSCASNPCLNGGTCVNGTTVHVHPVSMASIVKTVKETSN